METTLGDSRGFNLWSVEWTLMKQNVSSKQQLIAQRQTKDMGDSRLKFIYTTLWTTLNVSSLMLILKLHGLQILFVCLFVWV